MKFLLFPTSSLTASSKQLGEEFEVPTEADARAKALRLMSAYHWEAAKLFHANCDGQIEIAEMSADA